MVAIALCSGSICWHFSLLLCGLLYEIWNPPHLYSGRENSRCWKEILTMTKANYKLCYHRGRHQEGLRNSDSWTRAVVREAHDSGNNRQVKTEHPTAMSEEHVRTFKLYVTMFFLEFLWLERTFPYLVMLTIVSSF